MDRTFGAISRKVAVSTAITTLLLTAPLARAASTPEGRCQQGRYNAAAKYNQCEQKAVGRFFAAGEFADFVGFQRAVSKCRVRYADTWAKLQALASGSGATCDATRFAESAGTMTDNLTGLQWEQKTDDGTVHDKDNLYTLSTGAGGSTAHDGSAFTNLLATLNGGSCFAGHCDWRLPTRAELQTILAGPAYGCAASPCIDPAFGPSSHLFTWSSTTYATLPNVSWMMSFDVNAVVNADFNESSAPIRAVRGGL